MSIRQLPSHVVDKLKSSVTITSLNGVACGLLANALDAGASKVNISIDYARGNCTVEDNGSGISPEEFKDGGGIGKLHRMSKSQTPDLGSRAK
jgi:DNA mismatch repair protein MLH3